MSIKVTNENFKDFTSDGVSLVDFYADWCGPCKAIGPVIEQLSGEYDGVKIGKLDVDQNKETAEELGVRSIPTILVYKNGEVVEKHVGAASKSHLRSLIDKHL